MEVLNFRQGNCDVIWRTFFTFYYKRCVVNRERSVTDQWKRCNYVSATALFRSASTGEDVFLSRQQWRLEDGADDGGEDHGSGEVRQEQVHLPSTHGERLGYRAETPTPMALKARS